MRGSKKYDEAEGLSEVRVAAEAAPIKQGGEEMLQVLNGGGSSLVPPRVTCDHNRMGVDHTQSWQVSDTTAYNCMPWTVQHRNFKAG